MSDLVLPSSLLAQETAVRAFEGALATDRVAGAYLLHGPDGVGRSVGARIFACALLCRSPRGIAACGACGACRRLASGSHPDLLWVAADSGPRFDDDEAAERANPDVFTRAARIAAKPGPRRTIGVRVLRRLLEILALAAAEGGRKVAVLDAFDEIEEEGTATLLKTLEEAPPRTTFLLLSRGIDAVPDTILSRCQRVRFRPLPPEFVRRILAHPHGATLASEDVELLVRVAQGSAGRALRAAADGLHKAPAAAARDLLALGDAAAPEDVLAWTSAAGKDLAAQRERARQFIALLLVLLRDGWSASRGPVLLGAARSAMESLDANVAPELVLRALWSRTSRARGLPV